MPKTQKQSTSSHPLHYPAFKPLTLKHLDTLALELYWDYTTTHICYSRTPHTDDWGRSLASWDMQNPPIEPQGMQLNNIHTSSALVFQDCFQ